MYIITFWYNLTNMNEINTNQKEEVKILPPSKERKRDNIAWAIMVSIIIFLTISIAVVVQNVFEEPMSIDSISGIVLGIDLDGKELTIMQSYIVDNPNEPTEKSFVLKWDSEVQPHSPELLRGGELVVVTLDNQTFRETGNFYIENLEIIVGHISE